MGSTVGKMEQRGTTQNGYLVNLKMTPAPDILGNMTVGETGGVQLNTTFYVNYK